MSNEGVVLYIYKMFVNDLKWICFVSLCVLIMIVRKLKENVGPNLFLWGFTSHSRIFHSITDEGQLFCHLNHSGDLLLWVGPLSCYVHIHSHRENECPDLYQITKFCRVRRQEIENFMTRTKTCGNVYW